MATWRDTAAFAWHTMDAQDAFRALESSNDGLAPDEAQRRLEQCGPNALPAAAHTSALRLILDQFKNVLILTLLAAALVAALLGEQFDAAVIAVIVVFAAGLGFAQEFRAERAIEALRQMAAPRCLAVRGGSAVDLAAAHLVPGDVVLLKAGDCVPADLRLVEAVNLQVEEASLTGESTPVEKDPAPLAAEHLPVGDRIDIAFAGTAITAGRGRGLVFATGLATEFGSIAAMLQRVVPLRTPLQENLDRVGAQLARVALVLVALIAGAGLLRGQGFLEVLLFGVALAVAVVPEALPAVVTISLAIGVQRMARRHALLRRLPAVETLGSTTVICSDKTGTLTKDEMTVQAVYAGGWRYRVTGAGYDPEGEILPEAGADVAHEELAPLLRAACLACDAIVERSEEDARWHVLGDPTEGALVVLAMKAGFRKTDLDAAFPRVAEIPFDSDRKRMTTLHETPGGKIAFTKGAAERVLASCTSLDAIARENIRQEAHAMAARGLRVLAVAEKRGATIEDCEDDLQFLGLCGMLDPPRAESREAVKRCQGAGIKVVMITGDHPVTAEVIARDLGILDTGRVVGGDALAGMSDEALKAAAPGIDVYARVSPADKLRVVSALQGLGHVVAMTGDGVNDAPALKKADIGIAMGINGTDVSREAAAMTLTDDNFASIVAAVEEGRAIYDNIKKYLTYLLTANIGEILLMAAAALCGLPMPLSAVQILYVNLATDGLPALALALDPPARNLMRRHPRDPRQSIFTAAILRFMLLGGAWAAVANLALFAWSQHRGDSASHSMALVFTSLILSEFVKAYAARSEYVSTFHRPFVNGWLNLAIGWELLLLAVLLYLPLAQPLFDTRPLGVRDWMLILPAALSLLPVMELVKLVNGRWGSAHY